MVLQIVKYGHPALRQKGRPVEKVTPAIEELIANMFDTMYKAAGVGLAAQQVGEALQLTVIDVRAANKERPSTLEIEGKPADIETMMPLVLINPKIQPFGDPVSGPEGCLSFPELYADIQRPEGVHVRAQDAKGRDYEFKAGGLLSRAVQHEVDHLNGILFIDRMSSEAKTALKPELDKLQALTKAGLKRTSA